MPSIKLILFSTVVALISCFAYLLATYWHLPPQANCRGEPNAIRVFTADSLSRYTSPDVMHPMLIAIMGEVFGVPFNFDNLFTSQKGPRYSGLDNSRSYVPGKIHKNPQSDELLDLSPEEIKTVTWTLDYYRNSTTLIKVGVLHGRYFDCDGQPTEYRLKVLEKADLASNQDAELLQRHRHFCGDLRYPKRIIFCGTNRFPRLLRYKDGTEGECICVNDDDVKAFGSSTMTLHPYLGCEGSSSDCYLDPLDPEEDN